MSSIKLKTESILQVPLQNYENDFTFIINSERFETSSIVADLLSPIISKQRLIDPTIHELSIETKSRGDFRTILKLLNFKDIPIPEKDHSFIIEVLTQLGTENIEVVFPPNNQELTKENVLKHIKIHQKYEVFYKDQIQKEIDFISENFSFMKDDLIKFADEENDNDENSNIFLFESIIGNKKLLLENEDELLQTVNYLYLKDRKYSILYQFVDFISVEISSIKEFLSIFYIDDLNQKLWLSISNRLQQQVELSNANESIHKIIRKPGIEFRAKENEFDGIFRYLKNKGNIKDEIIITSSSKSGYDH